MRTVVPARRPTGNDQNIGTTSLLLCGSGSLAVIYRPAAAPAVDEDQRTECPLPPTPVPVTRTGTPRTSTTARDPARSNVVRQATIMRSCTPASAVETLSCIERPDCGTGTTRN